MWNFIDVISHRILWTVWTTSPLARRLPAPAGDGPGTTVDNPPNLWMIGGSAVEILGT